MKDKKVQVTEGFLCSAMILARDLKLVMDRPDLYEINVELYTLLINDIIKEVDAILEARERRKTYTAYKTAAKGTADREKLRQEYLDMVGIHKDWRTKTERRHEDL